jgi:sec-independent protein translocase protein TatC
MPVVLWQVWKFVAPGLYAHEKRFAVPFVIFSTVFFVAGGLFSHYVVFPFAWKFFAGFSTDYMAFLPRIQPVFSLYVRMLLAMGIVFEMPTLVFFLARVGVVTPRFLLRNVKYAILVIFVVAAVITPGPDIVSQLLVALPMIALYGLSIAIAWMFRKPTRGSADEDAGRWA